MTSRAEAATYKSYIESCDPSENWEVTCARFAREVCENILNPRKTLPTAVHFYQLVTTEFRRKLFARVAAQVWEDLQARGREGGDGTVAGGGESKDAAAEEEASVDDAKLKPEMWMWVQLTFAPYFYGLESSIPEKYSVPQQKGVVMEFGGDVDVDVNTLPVGVSQDYERSMPTSRVQFVVFAIPDGRLAAVDVGGFMGIEQGHRVSVIRAVPPTERKVFTWNPRKARRSVRAGTCLVTFWPVDYD